MADVKFLTMADIEQVNDIVEETMEIPEWGGPVRIRSLTKAAQGRIRRKSTKRNGEIDVDKSQMWLLLEGLVAPKVAQKDFAVFYKRQTGVIDRILTAISRLSGITTESEIAAVAVDDAEATFPEE
jgi:hypothetical protein